MQPRNKSPKLFIIAGPNGAGKTTFAKEFLPHYAKCDRFINADLIALGLAPFNPTLAAIKAGKLVLEEIRRLSEARKDFAFETTLSGKTYVPWLKRLKQQGYEVHIFYLWLPSVMLAWARVKVRVSQGGHHVPAADVRRRYKKSMQHFWHLYRPMADHWKLIDSSFPSPQLVASGSPDHIDLLDKEKFLFIQKHMENA